MGYLCLVVALYAFTAHYTKPENVGYDWIPFILLAMGPWYRARSSGGLP